MAEQSRKPKPKKDEEKATAEAEVKAEESGADVDELLDEIDEVLETNAEDFVRSYVQKGGQAFVPLVHLDADPWVLVVVMVALAVWRWRATRVASSFRSHEPKTVAHPRYLGLVVARSGGSAWRKP